MTEANDPDVVALSELVYGIIHHNDYGHRSITIPDGASPDIDYSYSWFMESDDALWMEVVKLNPNDFWRGYFYFNDMEPPEDAGEIEFNTREHADYHWESNNYDGHYDCTYYEHIVDGKVVETIKHNNQDWYNNEQEGKCN